jgi:3-deoxy-7-phosphoheptulonate synthase
VLADQIGAGEPGIVGIMLESFLQAGRQEPGDPATLVYGQSVNEACIDVDATAEVLSGLAAAVRRRRDVTPRRAVAGSAAAPAP